MPVLQAAGGCLPSKRAAARRRQTATGAGRGGTVLLGYGGGLGLPGGAARGGVAGGGLRWCGGGRGLVVPGAADARVVSGTASSTLEATLRLPWPDMLGLMQ